MTSGTKPVLGMLRGAVLAASVLALGACATTPMVTRHANEVDGLLTADPAELAAAPWTVVSINVTVPDTLTVSEANMIKPPADIVWREDPMGDRRAQVKAIVENAMAQAVDDMNGPREVILDIRMARFHAVTEKTRYSYSFGGEQELEFYMTVTDAKTGEVIVPEHLVVHNFPAYQGQAALNAEAAGITQKVRITEHLISVIRQEMAAPLVASAG